MVPFPAAWRLCNLRHLSSFALLPHRQIACHRISKHLPAPASYHWHPPPLVCQPAAACAEGFEWQGGMIEICVSPHQCGVSQLLYYQCPHSPHQDQAIEQLDKTWPEGSVLEIFLSPKYSNAPAETVAPQVKLSPFARLANGQLLSPELPLTRCSTVANAPIFPPASRSDALPKRIALLRTFVHEVLR